MSQAVIDSLVRERDQIIERVDALVGADDFDAADSEYVALRDRAAGLQTRIDSLREWVARKAAVADLDRGARAAAPSDPLGEPQPTSWGDVFVRSAEYADYPMRGRSARVQIADRALPMTLAGMSPAPRPQITLDDPGAPTPLLEALPAIPVAQSGLDIVRYAKTAGGAAVVPEGTAKPSAEWAATVTPITLDTVAVFTQATRQLLEDAGALRAMIDRELRREVLLKQDQLAAAAIHGETTIPQVGASSLLAAIYMARSAVVQSGYRPTHLLIHPDDLAEQRIASWSLQQPVDITAGLTVVEDARATLGEVIVGDLRAGVQRYQRTGVQIYITDSHADTFLSNVFTILAEGRERTVVGRPAALARGQVAP